MNPSRRDFLQAAAAMGIVGAPQFLLRAAQSVNVPGAGSALEDDRVLVVVQLSGGNDGLNTLVPYEHDVYHRNRATLRIDERSVLKINSDASLRLGFHPRMTDLHQLYKDGHVAIVPGVGYPNPNRSHFRSMDIWHSALPEIEEPSDGWLGRSVNSKRRLQPLFLGDDRLPLALMGDVPVPSIQNIDFLDFLVTSKGRKMSAMMRRLNARKREGSPEFVRSLAIGTVDELEKMVEIRGQKVPVDYPNSKLARRLQLTGQLISGGLSNRVYYLSQGGYDTHSQQAQAHAQLVGDLSGAIGAFYRHMETAGQHKRVVIMVFSEFGRRVRENGSLGTDHGVAAPLFVISGRARGGLHGDYPSLTNLTDGDIAHTTDFRRVYATLLDEVLGVQPKSILGSRFEKIHLLRRTMAL